MSADAARLALACLDLTDLSDDCRPSAVDALARRAITPFGPVAALCIWPQFVEHIRGRLPAAVKVATVINFPRGGENPQRAADDTREALRDGADEIDCVLPYRALMRDDETTVREVLEAVAQEVGDKTLKVILETGVLASPALIARASEIAIDCGAHFIKTSTGKSAVSATPEAATIMLQTIKSSGRNVGFKASGGIRTLADATTYLDLADSIMGPGWAKPATFRFGASGLLDALVAALDGREERGADGY